MPIKSGERMVTRVLGSVKEWVVDHLLEVFLFFIISAIATPTFFYNDNNFSYFAVNQRSFVKCNKISTQFIKQKCFDRVLEAKLEKCPDFALNGNIDGCRRDMTARYKGLRPKEKFPLKLALYLFLEFVLGLYFFYLKEKWSSW